MKKHDENIAAFIENAVRKTNLEAPSPDFTLKIMGQIAVANQSKNIKYKPLISKKMWACISGFIAFIIAYSFSSKSNDTEEYFNLFSKIKSTIPYIHFSDATTYAIVIITFMVLIQISILKNLFDKQFKI